MMTVDEKRAAFRALHRPGDPVLMPNPWDLGSARVLAALGAKAVATTSSGHAFTLGRPDMGHVARDEALEHAAAIVGAVDLPVNADLENGYGADPEIAAETVRLAAAAGLAGCSIEDTVLPGGTAAYPLDLALARARACVAAARESGIVLTLRADGFLTRAYDADEALRRCAAFAEAGADVIYAPLVPVETLKAMAKIGAPVNALAAGKMARHSVADYAAMGVARISVGGALARYAQAALIDAGRLMLETGDLTPLTRGAPGPEVDALLAKGRG